MPASAPALAFDALNAHLLAIEKEMEKELSKELRRIGNEVRDKVRSSTEPPHRTGKLRKSIKTSVRRKSEVSLYSNLPQAPPWHWGGTIKPRGVPITFPRTEFVSGPVEELGDDVAEKLADALDQIAHRHGFI